MNEPKRRQGWKTFLTPGWILTAVLVLTFTYYAFTFLGPWQLNKGEQKSEFNQRLADAMEHDPVPVSEVLPADGGSAGVEKEWTHVRLQGEFLPSAQVLLRNRPVDSSPAFQVLTPFKTTTDQTILVNRGWTPPEQGADVPEIPAPPTGEVTVTGFVRMSEAEAITDPVESQGHTQVSGIHTATISKLMQDQLRAAGGGQLVSEYVQMDEQSVDAMGQQDSSDATLHAISLPQLDNGPHLSYGIQWITFGIAAPAALIWFAYAEIRERRREKQEIAESEAKLLNSSGAAPGGAEPVGHESGETAMAEPAGSAQDAPAEPVSTEKAATAERKLADRYGGTRSRFEERRTQKRGERF